MLFNSFPFLIFFPIVTLVYFLIPHKVRYIWLLACSYFFYMCWNPWYILLILFSTVVTFASGILIEKQSADKKKRIIVALSFVANLGMLALFKYYNFFVDNINWGLRLFGLNQSVRNRHIILPVGISFFSFQALSYTVDVYRGDIKPVKNFLKYALFVSFFPQLVAGPIERSGKLISQFEEEHKWDYNRARDGLLLMLYGYFMKMVVADRIAIFVGTVYGDISTYGGWYLIVASMLFSIQIFCDFAGYSTIALGAARVLGFELTDNFNAPYFSKSIAEFWGRWHISLMNWFRDYIYIPLGGNRKGTVRKYVNVMVVFLISGFWHGASWAFILWGAINGIYQITGKVLTPLRNKVVSIFGLNRESFGHRFFKVVVTYLLVTFAWVFFRAGDTVTALLCVKSIFTANNPWVLFDNSLYELGLDWKNFQVMLLSIGILGIAEYCKYKGIIIRKNLVNQNLWFRWLVYIVAIVAIFVFGIYGSAYDEAGFIYFQF